MRRLSSVTWSSATLRSMRPPSALTMTKSRAATAAGCASAGGAIAAAPASARKVRRSSSRIGNVLDGDRAIVGALEAAAALHGEQDRAQIGNVGDGIALEHDEIGEPAARDHSHRVGLSERHGADLRSGADRRERGEAGSADEQLHLVEQ